MIARAWGLGRQRASQIKSLPTIPVTSLRCFPLYNSARHNTASAESPSKGRRETGVDKNLVREVLNSTATKRDARLYLSRFKSPKLERSSQTKVRPTYGKVGVNLGNLYLPLRAVVHSPVFTQKSSNDRFAHQASPSLHVALVKIRAPQALDDATLTGVGHTLSQLALLGLGSVVIVDCDDGETKASRETRLSAIEQAGRIVDAIDSFGGHGARRLDNVIGLSPIDGHSPPSGKVRSGLRIAHRKFLLDSLQRGVIPVIVPIGFMPGIHSLVPVEAKEVLLALTREFAGIQTEPMPDESPYAVADRIKKLQAEISLDRIILLDPLGGIPSLDGNYNAHVFINLEQEYSGIRNELVKLKVDLDQSSSCEAAPGKPFKSMHENETTSQPRREDGDATHINHRISGPLNRVSSAQIHLANLDLLKQSLTILPPSASALLTTAQEAANIRPSPHKHSQIPGVGTRPQRNPLIYNLLTDKPVFSSSLPSAQGPKPSHAGADTNCVPSPATFVKRGMSVTIIPDPSIQPWHPPIESSSSVQLLDSRLDLARLVHLIEDSFSRQLDVPHYISRIESSLAGIIIAGGYEGGAILTWETPPHKSPLTAPKVPYLDKFAVLKRSQGAGGVADIVFNAMVRNCFPDGVCWRSRTDNPVNKWYFERAKGTWKIPGSNWTMFWTTEGVEKGDDTFLDYEAVCRSVVPSWADKKAVVD